MVNWMRQTLQLQNLSQLQQLSPYPLQRNSASLLEIPQCLENKPLVLSHFWMSCAFVPAMLYLDIVQARSVLVLQIVNCLVRMEYLQGMHQATNGAMKPARKDKNSAQRISAHA